MMRLLAIDTSTAALGVAAVEAGLLVRHESRNGPFGHVEAVVPTVARFLDELDWSPRTLDTIAVAAGPGSFTGLRVGMAAAKALALATAGGVVSVDTLEAWAFREAWLRGPHRAGDRLPLLVPMMDARKQRFYAAVFRAALPHPADSRESVRPERLSEDLDEPIAGVIQRASELRNADDSWCTPGPSAVGDSPHDGTPSGRVSAVARGGSAVVGVALIGNELAAGGYRDDPYAGPNYVRSGDVGTGRSLPRFEGGEPPR